MRIPLTPLGARDLLLLGVLPAALAVWLLAAGPWWAGLLPAALAAFVFNFFRDPERAVPADEGVLVSPADGTVASVLEVDEPHYVKGPAIRVGIFLSVFNVHVNRSPARGVVEYVAYTPGKFLDARDPRCSAENEANAIGIRLDDGRRVLVRQVAGLIARRILCTVRVGDRVERGQRIGMIKFGSYTELIAAKGQGFAPCVALGAKPKGAATILFRGTAGATR